MLDAAPTEDWAEARISRPSRYQHVASKEALLPAAVEHALPRDITAAEQILADTETRCASG